ncbi:MAG: hypothetical protein HKM95_10455 [Inquilinus sp.]|nr:hypothetical protein [Inquilinus sp.]
MIEAALLDDPRVVAALISFSAAVLLWSFSKLVDFLATVWRYNEEIANMAAALRAEIDANIEAQKSVNRRNIVEIGARLDEDPKFVPYVSVERDLNPIFRELQGDIVRLPYSAQGAVMRYYKLDSFIDSILKDMQTDRFAALEADRKKSLLDNLAKTMRRSTTASKEATERLDQVIATYRHRPWPVLRD